MKTKLYLLIILVGLFFCVCEKGKAQAPDWLWAKSAGGTQIDMARSVGTDASGNSYVIGSFYSSTITFGSITLNRIGQQVDIFIVKYDSTGNVLWAKSQGDSASEFALGIAVDSIGNSYITGYFNGPKLIFGNDTLVNAWPGNKSNFFIAKYDSSGNPVWARSAGGTSSVIATPGEQGCGVAVDRYGNSYATGFFSDSIVTFGGVSLTKSGGNGYFMFVVKYDAAGNAIWAKSAGSGTGNYETVGRGIAADANGNSYVTGNFRSPTIIFGNDTLTNGGTNNVSQVFVVKYDSTGNELWAISGVGSFHEFGYGIAVDAGGSCSVTGAFGGFTITFDGITLTNANVSFGSSYDVFVVKFETNGTVAWAKSAGGIGDDGGNSIAIDKSGNSYITGQFRADTIAFGNIVLIKVPGPEDIFVAKYDGSGTVAWAKSVGNSNVDIGSGIAVDNDDNAYVTGLYSSFTLAFGNDTLINASPANDMFIAKLSSCQTSSTDTVIACNIYTSPSGNYVWNVSGIYKDTIPNASGCDSILTINLTINTLSTSSSQTGTACNSYTSPSGNYVWTTSGVYLDTIPNSMGCDSIITINLTVNTVDTTVTQTGNVLSANLAGITYQWLDCNNGFSIISGATNQLFAPASIGNYAVAVAQNGCVDTSGCYAVIGVGINETSATTNFIISPNPVNDVLNVSLNKPLPANTIITISDMQGRVVGEKNTNHTYDSNSSVIPIDVSALSQGVYLLRVDGVVRRFVKL